MPLFEQPVYSSYKKAPPMPDLIEMAHDIMLSTSEFHRTSDVGQLVYAQCLLLEDIARSLRGKA